MAESSNPQEQWLIIACVVRSFSSSWVASPHPFNALWHAHAGFAGPRLKAEGTVSCLRSHTLSERGAQHSQLMCFGKYTVFVPDTRDFCLVEGVQSGAQIFYARVYEASRQTSVNNNCILDRL